MTSGYITLSLIGMKIIIILSHNEAGAFLHQYWNCDTFKKYWISIVEEMRRIGFTTPPELLICLLICNKNTIMPLRELVAHMIIAAIILLISEYWRVENYQMQKGD